MKTNEFVAKLGNFADKYGYNVEIDYASRPNNHEIEFINLVDHNRLDAYDKELLTVEAKVQYAVDTVFIAFEELDGHVKAEVMDYIVLPYIQTPVEEREEEKEYTYKLPDVFEARYFAMDTRDGIYYFATFPDEEGRMKKKFKDSEYEKLPPAVREVLKTLQQVRVQ